MAFTNTSDNKTYTITYHPYSVGEKICNIFDSSDCTTCTSAGVVINLSNGEVKLYKLVSSME